MVMSFSELWEEAETVMQDEVSVSSSEELVKEAEGKLRIYNLINRNSSMPEEDQRRLKSHTFGKIMLVLTQLSAKDNINVYAALKTALDETKIGLLESKYK